jgi:hypothetical protein
VETDQKWTVLYKKYMLTKGKRSEKDKFSN